MDVYDEAGNFLRHASGGEFRSSVRSGPPAGKVYDATDDDYEVRVYCRDDLVGVFYVEKAA